MTRSVLIVTQKTHVTIDLSKKSEWVPKPSKKVTLKSCIDNVKSDILRTAKVNTDSIDDLTPGELTVLQNLGYNEDIIIKPADKGSAVSM